MLVRTYHYRVPLSIMMAKETAEQCCPAFLGCAASLGVGSGGLLCPSPRTPRLPLRRAVQRRFAFLGGATSPCVLGWRNVALRSWAPKTLSSQAARLCSACLFLRLDVHRVRIRRDVALRLALSGLGGRLTGLSVGWCYVASRRRGLRLQEGPRRALMACRGLSC